MPKIVAAWDVKKLPVGSKGTKETNINNNPDNFNLLFKFLKLIEFFILITKKTKKLNIPPNLILIKFQYEIDEDGKMGSYNFIFYKNSIVFKTDPK